MLNKLTMSDRENKENKENGANKHNRAKFYKKIMRLCAFAMLEDGTTIHEKEKFEIQKIVQDINFYYKSIEDFLSDIYNYRYEKNVKSGCEVAETKAFFNVINKISQAKENLTDVSFMNSFDLEQGEWETLSMVFTEEFYKHQFCDDSKNGGEEPNEHVLKEILANKNKNRSLSNKYILGRLQTEYKEKVLSTYNGIELDSIITEKLKNPDNSKSMFMNIESLDNKEKTCELIEMVIIAKSDGSLTDRERELFCIICKLYGVKDGKKLWKNLTEKSTTDLRNLCTDDDIIKKTDVVFDYNIIYLDDNDFKDIERSIKFYDINGPINDGIHHLLNRVMVSYKDKVIKTDRNINQKAILLFIISALLLFLGIIDIKNHSFLLSCWGAIKEAMSDPSLIIVGKFFLFVASFITGILSFVKFRKQRNKYFHKNERCPYRLAFISACCIVIAFKHMALLVMMLSIEWLIFMKEQLIHNYSLIDNNTRESSEKSSNSSILIVIVAAAIIADICLGLIEIYQNNDGEIDIKEFLVKTASAVFLGCICFFCGKFLDNFRMEQIRSLDTMNEVINEIGRKDRENNPNNFYSKVAFLKEQFNNRNYNP